MDEEPLYSISWTDFITEEPRSLKIWGNVDKTDSRVYYTCLVNVDKTIVKWGIIDAPIAVISYSTGAAFRHTQVFSLYEIWFPFLQRF